MDPQQDQSILGDELSVTPSIQQYVADATKWARFLCIIITVFMVLCVGFVLLGGNGISGVLEEQFRLPSGGFGILIGVLMFIVFIVGILFYFLWRFATLTKRGLEIRNQDMFNKGLAALKIYFTIYGVFTVIGMVSTIRILFTLF